MSEIPTIPPSASDSLTVIDNRTGQQMKLPITDDTISAADLKKLAAPDGPGLATYDPGLTNTASCRSAVTFIDGDAGVLEYRGYPIEQLAEECTYLEVAYLLIHGELPTEDQLAEWTTDINTHRFVHENQKSLFTEYRYDAHPMAMLMSAVAGMHTFYPDSHEHTDESRMLQARRLIAKMPTLAAFSYRHTLGRPFVYPVDSRDYVENFVTMLFQLGNPSYKPDPRLVRAIEVLFILHADHEQNCSTSAVRAVASADNDPYTSVSAGIGALFGPLHGGANEAVLRMLERIQTGDDIGAFIDGVKSGKEKLMGFGHRVYKNYDPRARIIRGACEDVFAVTGVNPKLEIAQELEHIALNDEYFVNRRLYPNVDFYSGLIYEALGFPAEMFTVMFAIGRTSGWLAHYLEQVTDPEQKITRPKQIYTGYTRRDVLSFADRGKPESSENDNAA